MLFYTSRSFYTSNPKAVGPPLVSYQLLFIQYIRKCPPISEGCVLRPEPENAPCRSNMDSLSCTSHFVRNLRFIIEDFMRCNYISLLCDVLLWHSSTALIVTYLFLIKATSRVGGCKISNYSSPALTLPSFLLQPAFCFQWNIQYCRLLLYRPLPAFHSKWLYPVGTTDTYVIRGAIKRDEYFERAMYLILEEFNNSNT
jgi:hypothetical protein